MRAKLIISIGLGSIQFLELNLQRIIEKIPLMEAFPSSVFHLYWDLKKQWHLDWDIVMFILIQHAYI
jgi:hypothetical protein